MSIFLIHQSMHWQVPVLPHRHPYWEISVNLEGSGIAEVNGQQVPYTPGTILCVPPHTPHSFPVTGGFADLYYQTDYALSNQLSNAVLVLHDDDSSSFRQLLHISKDILDARRTGFSSILQAMDCTLAQVLQSYVQADALNPVVLDIQSYIRRQYSDPQLSIQSCLQQSGYSIEYVRTLFKQELGMTPTQYLQWTRVESAKQLIAARVSNPISYGAIAEACGWLDTHYFNRVFKKQVGMSPSQYYDFCNRPPDLQALTHME